MTCDKLFNETSLLRAARLMLRRQDPHVSRCRNSEKMLGTALAKDTYKIRVASARHIVTVVRASASLPHLQLLCTGIPSETAYLHDIIHAPLVDAVTQFLPADSFAFSIVLLFAPAFNKKSHTFA